MARKANLGGLLALGAVGVGAYFLFFRKGGGASMPSMTRAQAEGGPTAQSAIDEVMQAAKLTGAIPMDATYLYLAADINQVHRISDMPGAYVMPAAQAEALPMTAEGAIEEVDSGSTSGEALTFLGLGRHAGSSFRSSFGASFAKTVEEQQRSPGVFQGYGRQGSAQGFMNTVMQGQRGLTGYGATPYYDRNDGGQFIPYGDYVQLPYHAGA